MTTFPRLSTTSIGRNKLAPRVWLEGLYLLHAGFAPTSRIQVEFSTRKVSIKLAPEGSRVVSSKKQGQIPVLDLNSSALVDTFGPIKILQVYITEGEIVLTPTHSEELRATRCRNGREGSCYSGGGLLTEAAKLAGYKPAFAIEIEQDYAQVYEENHPEAVLYNLSVENVPLDTIPPVEIITMGIPCEPYSNARRLEKITGAKRDRTLPPEAHPLSDLTIWAALLIRKLNPATVVIEEAPGYLNSGAGYMMCHFLDRAGYTVEAAVLDPRDFGELSGRKRSVIVAHSGNGFAWPTPIACTRTLADVMDDPETVEREFFTAEDKPWLVNHWTKQTEKGNGFAPPQLTEDSTSIPTFKKRYFSQQGDGAVVKHKSKPNTWRWCTIQEVRRIHGIPETYKFHEAKTKTGEILGQGVIVSFFEKIISGTRNLGTVQTKTDRAELKNHEYSDNNSPSIQPTLTFA